MNSARVIHLVSNSLTFPGNKPNDFKVGFNVPFNLTGKKVALVDATLTKAQPNVVDEVITINVPPIVTKAPYTTHNLIETSKLLPAGLVNNFNNMTFYNLFRTPAKTREQDFSYSIETKRIKIPNYISVVVDNESYSDLHVSFLGELEKYKGWNFVGASLYDPITFRAHDSIVGLNSDLFLYGITAPKTSVTRPGASANAVNSNIDQMNFKIPPGKKVIFTFDIGHILKTTFDTVAKVNKILELIYFKIRFEKATLMSAGYSHKIAVEKGEYLNVEAVIAKINKITHFKPFGQFKLSRGFVEFKKGKYSNPFEIKLGGLEKHFGFNNSTLSIGSKTQDHVQRAQKPPDMTRGTHNFFIYCSLVKDVAVNERILQLLGTVDAIKGKYGEQVRHPVQIPLFVDCVGGDQQMIEVTIADNQGNSNGLLMGTSQLTLSVSD